MAANSPLLSVERICAYTPANPASTSASEWKAVVGVSALCGTSVSFVHVSPTKNTGMTSSARSPKRSMLFDNDLLICARWLGERLIGAIGLELEGDAEGVGSCTRIGEVVQATNREPTTTTVRRVDLRIEPGVVRQEQQVVTRDVHARRLTGHQALRNVECVADGDVLQACEGAVLDPSRGILRRFADAVRIRERGREEVATLLGVALRLIDQRRVVEHLAAELAAPQPARVELVPAEIVVETEGEVRIGAADELAVRIRRVGGDAVLAGGIRRRRAVEELLASLDVEEPWRVEAA